MAMEVRSMLGSLIKHCGEKQIAGSSIGSSHANWKCKIMHLGSSEQLVARWSPTVSHGGGPPCHIETATNCSDDHWRLVSQPGSLDA